MRPGKVSLVHAAIIPTRHTVCKFVRQTLPGLSFMNLIFYLADVSRLASQTRRCLSGLLPKHHPEAIFVATGVEQASTCERGLQDGLTAVSP